MYTYTDISQERERKREQKGNIEELDQKEQLNAAKRGGLQRCGSFAWSLPLNRQSSFFFSYQKYYELMFSSIPVFLMSVYAIV
jgi:hypothetical protein